MDRILGPELKTAWITGASTGLGRALALELARAGWCVAASARSAEKLATLSDEASGLAGSIVGYKLDVTDQREVAAIVAAVERDLGPIHQAVLNAGSHRPGNARDFKSVDAAALVELNLMGTIYGLEAVLPGMLARRSGRIAMVASLAGYRGLPSAGAYGMTKAGLINLAESLRPELLREGIVMQVVNPGFVRTPLTDRNDFPMPFLMEPDAAARAFYRGLQSDRFEVIFPQGFAYLMKLYRLLPYPLAFALAKRLLPES